MPRSSPTHVDDPVAAGLRLKEARERVELSQRELAFPGCSATYISRIEAGERTASPQVLDELARRLGVSEAYLANGGARTAALLEDAEIALKLDEVEVAAELFERVAADAHEDQVRARASEGLGEIALRRGNAELAAELLEEALSLAGDLSEHGALAESLARTYAIRGEPARSIALLERCLEEHARDPVQYLRFAGLLGSVLAENGSLDDAERLLTNTLPRGREFAGLNARARLYWRESRALRERGERELAASFARRAREILRGREDSLAVAHLLQTLAQIQLERGRPADALEHLREASDLILGAGTALEIARYRIEEARALLALGERGAAGALAFKLESELRDVEAPDAGRLYALLGSLFADLGDALRARALLERAIALLEDQAPSLHLVRSYRRLADLLRAQGDTEAALAILDRALGTQERVVLPAAPRLEAPALF